MGKQFKATRGRDIVVTALGAQDNPDLELYEGLEGVIIGNIKEYNYVSKLNYLSYLIRFPHGSFFLLREHFLIKEEKEYYDANRE